MQIREEYLQEEFDGIYKAARRELVRTAVRRKLLNDIKENTVTDSVLKDAVDRLGRDAFLQKKDPGMWLITIGAKEGIDPLEFWKQMENCIKKKYVAGTGEYVIEQRGENGQEPYGWHIHWVLKPAVYTSKSVKVQQVYQCFKKFVAGDNYIDVKPVTRTPECVLKYIEGIKKDEGKHAKVEQDKVVRLRIGIPDKISY